MSCRNGLSWIEQFPCHTVTSCKNNAVSSATDILTYSSHIEEGELLYIKIHPKSPLLLWADGLRVFTPLVTYNKQNKLDKSSRYYTLQYFAYHSKMYSTVNEATAEKQKRNPFVKQSFAEDSCMVYLTTFG